MTALYAASGLVPGERQLLDSSLALIDVALFTVPMGRHILCRWCKPPGNVKIDVQGPQGRHNFAVSTLRACISCHFQTGGSHHRQGMCRHIRGSKHATSKLTFRVTILSILLHRLRARTSNLEIRAVRNRQRRRLANRLSLPSLTRSLNWPTRGTRHRLPH